MQHQGGGNVQDVQRPRAQRRGVLPRQSPGHIVHRRWNGRRLERRRWRCGLRAFPERGPGLRRRDLAPEYSQFDGICQFRLAERSQQERPGRLAQYSSAEAECASGAYNEAKTLESR